MTFVQEFHIGSVVALKDGFWLVGNYRREVGENTPTRKFVNGKWRAGKPIEGKKIQFIDYFILTADGKTQKIASSSKSVEFLQCKKTGGLAIFSEKKCLWKEFPNISYKNSFDPKFRIPYKFKNLLACGIRELQFLPKDIYESISERKYDFRKIKNSDFITDGVKDILKMSSKEKNNKKTLLVIDIHPCSVYACNKIATTKGNIMCTNCSKVTISYTCNSHLDHRYQCL